MVSKVSVQCGGMRLNRERRIALILSFGVVILTVLPYLVAVGIAPVHTRFTGFLLNPIDGYTYLSKMLQGAEGHWTFILPYAPEPGPRTFLFVYYLFLGQVSRFLSLDTIILFHLARILTATLMFYCAYLLCERICSHRHIRWFAFGLILLASGLGWLSIFIPSLESSDILIPESVPFLIAYSNAHFPLAAAGLLIGILATLADGWEVWRRVLIAGLSGTVIGAVLPFSTVSLIVIVGLWIVLELWTVWRGPYGKSRLRASINISIALISSTLGALPWLIYDLWVSRTHPVISAWNVQNQTLSPAPIAYILGFGPLLILSAVGILHAKPWRSAAGRLLLVWLIASALLLYAPLAFQRRLSLGIAFPLSILAAWGWGSIPMELSWRRILGTFLFILLSLTNLVIIFAGLSGVVRGETAVTYELDEYQSYFWIGENVPDDTLWLTGERAGNRLPAFAPIRVLYGHPFETPGAENQRLLIESLYQGEDTIINALQDLNVEWVYYGSEEKELGQPAWLSQLDLAWEQGNIEIYKVPIP